jgi:death-on-curing protein
MTAIVFLSVEQVLEIHDELIDELGGLSGVHDFNLLSSAISEPMFVSQYQEDIDLFYLAAIYFYHLIKNHTFKDGNKRTALVSMLTFLRLNGIHLKMKTSDAFNLAINTANSSFDKKYIANFIRSYESSIDA